MFTTLRSRLFISYMIVIGIILCVIGAGLLLYIIRNPAVDRQIYTRLDQVADTILRKELIGSTNRRRLPEITQQIADLQDVRLLILASTGEVIHDTGDGGIIQFRAKLLRTAQSRRGIAIDPDKVPWLYVWRPLEDGFFVIAVERPSRVSLLFSQRLREILRDDLLPPFMKAGAIALGLALISAFWISNWISIPLKGIAKAADHVAAGRFQEVPVLGPKETQSLARAFNMMIKRIDASQQSQKDFIANVSHELKTPLTSILGFTQAISDGTAGTQDELTKATTVIETEARRMYRLVMDLLDLARLDAGILEMERSPMDLEALLQKVVDRFSLQAINAKVDLAYRRNPLPEVVGDHDRLMQVFTNLVDNAIKNTPEGGVVILEAQPVGTDIQVVVKDSGCGIADKDIDRIFERFYQVDKSRAGNQDRGSGLGLSIVKEIVQAHGGSITVESPSELGSTFMVKIPITRQDYTTAMPRNGT
jgi:two-component system OmpR family sensor kinase